MTWACLYLGDIGECTLTALSVYTTSQQQPTGSATSSGRAGAGAVGAAITQLPGEGLKPLQRNYTFISPSQPASQPASPPPPSPHIHILASHHPLLSSALSSSLRCTQKSSPYSSVLPALIHLHLHLIRLGFLSTPLTPSLSPPIFPRFHALFHISDGFREIHRGLKQQRGESREAQARGMKIGGKVKRERKKSSMK